MIDWRDRISISGAVVISVIVVCGFAMVCGALFFLKIPQEMKEIAMLLLGILGAGFTTTVNYWMGSSSSSQKQAATIAETAKSAADTAANVATAAAAKVP